MSFPSFAEWADVLQIRDELAWGQLWAQYPMYPLHSEGLALPGPDFDREAQLCGDTAPELSGTGSKKQLDNYGANLTYLHLQALYDPDFMLYCDFRGSAIPTPFVGGHILGDSPHGPVRARVMIIGKHPKAEEVQQGLNFVCPSASSFWRALDDLRIPVEEYAQWYVTNLVRHNKIDPASNKVTPASVKNCLPLLQQELRLVRPEFILCFGTEAAKALLGNGHSVSDMFGRAIDFKIPINLPWEEPQYHTAKLMVCLDPAAVHHSPFKYDEYRDSFELFWRLTEGDKIGEVELDIDHREFDDEASLAAFVDELIAEGQTDFAIDAEWHKDAPQEEGAYLRTIQVSGKAKQAFLVNLRDAGGRVTFQPSLKAALPHLQRLLKRTPERFTTVGGHFLRADMPWLLHYGLDVRAEYAPAETWELQAAGKGGWDTALMLHGVMETGPFGLEYATSRLCGIPRYDIPLEKWKRQYCLENKLEPEQLDGYGMCPRSILNKYALYDSDGTKRVKERAAELLNQDAFGLNSWKAFWQAHRASLGFLEMELWGMSIDRKQADLLTDDYVQMADTRLADFRQRIEWEKFNPNSVYQVRELLFGENLNDKRDKITGENVRLRPAEAVSLYLDPVKTTGKPSKDWCKIVERGEEGLYKPSTDRESLGILLHQYPGDDGDMIFQLRDIKYLQQALRQVLRRPQKDADGELLVDDDGHHVYEKALVSWRWRDGRIHTHLSQNKETGRASSYRPPLQNISKRRETDYKLIFGDKYRAPLRSILCASPGMFLVEVDIKSAELAVLAWMSGDPQFIEDVRRNMLPESHPEYLDLHSERAVSAFKLACAPTKKGLESIDKEGMRVAAKNVNFGVPYGRAADAIARQCREEGCIVTISEAQALIDAYHARYPVASAFLAECRERSRSPGWLCGAYGRYRRFFTTDDAKIIGEQERQACNFPIQNGVADYISEVIWQLMDYRAAHGSKFRLVMQIHDALLFEVSEEHLPELVNTIIPECMTRRVPFRPCHLDGTPQDVAPYYFGVDVEVYRNWGVKVKKDELAKFGVAV